MQLNEVPAQTGYVWFRQGIWLFKRSPLALLTTVLTYMFVMLLTSLLPIVGPIVVLIAAPGLSVGLMAACRAAATGKPFLPTVLVSGFRAHGMATARQLLQLGLLYTACGVAALLIVALVSGDAGLQWRALADGNEEALSNAQGFPLTMLLSMLAYLPMAMLFWFAPILCAWHGVPPLKAMFFSFVACWRNRYAFLCYGALWLLTGVAAAFVAVFVAQASGIAQLGVGVMMPMSMALATLLYCSHYASYCSSFGLDEKLSS